MYRVQSTAIIWIQNLIFKTFYQNNKNIPFIYVFVIDKFKIA